MRPENYPAGVLWSDDMLTQLDATIHLLKALPNAGDDDRPLLNIARTRLTDLAQKLDTNLDRLNNPSSRSPR